MIKYEELVKTNMSLDDEKHDISYYLNDEGKVTHRVVYFNNQAKREYPYSSGDPALNKSGRYSYKQLYAQKTKWK